MPTNQTLHHPAEPGAENLSSNLSSAALPADIARFYPEEPKLRELLYLHSRAVADEALRVCEHHPELDADREFVERAALLHDIGIASCDAPGIYCHGELPYICHGVEGARILAAEGLLAEARVCERHTGSGLTAEEIIREALPIPERDMLPVSIEEKIICYADKFYSKTPGRLLHRKSLAKVIAGMARHGRAPLERFLRLHILLG